MWRNAIESRGIATQGRITAVVHALDNAPGRGHGALIRGAAPRDQLGDALLRAPPGRRDQLHTYNTTLFSGYSTIPVAFAALSLGTTSRTTPSSRIVFSATQSGSDSSETVGEFSAGNTASTAGRFIFSTFSIRPTRPCAEIAAFSISARLSIFCFFHASS